LNNKRNVQQVETRSANSSNNVYNQVDNSQQ